MPAAGNCPAFNLYGGIKARTLAAASLSGPDLSTNIAMNIELAREQMIEQQVHAWDVFDERVLNTMRAVRREQFAPAPFSQVAFADAPIPLPGGQSMLPAKIHGRILQALLPSPADV